MEKTDYLKDLGKCVLCGSCKAFCPTYDEEGTEAMGARGRLALLRGLSAGQLSPTPLLNDRIFSCLLCEACSDLCPSGVDIMEDIYKGRSLLKQSDRKRRLLRILTKLFIRNPALSFRISHILQNILFPYLSKKRFVPANFRLPDSPFRNGHSVYKVMKKKGRVAVFTGCSTNFLYPHLATSLVNILLKSGYEVIVPSGEVCCGAPLRALGLEDEAKELAKKNMRIFGRLKVEAVLSPCPTCILTIKKEYPKMIGSGIKNATDVISFLLEKLEILQLSLLGKRFPTAAYHDPCHLLYGLGVKNQARELLNKIGVSVIEKEGNGCCGFGGPFSLSFREISGNLLQKQAERYLATGADAVVTACPGCMMQLSKAIKDMPVFHIVELIEEAYCGSDEV
ncbi:MAG: (Fe-S)-binding protein [Nitrospirae bacterium]|nr:(Fe-S)-binding protein [Nitrospirota bacterium]